jgi:DUF4097 and DUF4098 domain-containing protein YvlB
METATGDRVDQSFEVGTPARFTLNTVSGSVTISAGEEGTIRVQGTKSGSQDARDNTTIEIEQHGDEVSVHTRTERGNGFGFQGKHGKMASVDFVVTVPPSTVVEVKTVSADVRVTGTGGPLSAQTVSGDLSVSGASGEMQITTVSGDLTADSLSGTLTLHSTSGDAHISSSDLRDFNLHSVSGDFYLDTPLASGEHYYAHTVSGDLQLSVPSGTGVTVQMKTVSGEVHTGFARAEIIKAGRRHWQGRINGGGANLEMHSVSGDLSIRGGEGDATGEDPGVLQESDSKAGEILRALEQGEIDVEQALAQLRGRR